MDEQNNNAFMIVYQAGDGSPRVDVRLQDENIWLSQAQIAELYHSSRTNVVEHIRHIYDEKELDENQTCRKFRQVRQEGQRQEEHQEIMLSEFQVCGVFVGTYQGRPKALPL